MLYLDLGGDMHGASQKSKAGLLISRVIFSAIVQE
jgi:hypothetical protein